MKGMMRVSKMFGHCADLLAISKKAEIQQRSFCESLNLVF